MNTNGATSLTNVTIAGNSAASNKGGAIFKSGSGTTTLLNTILANNTGGNVSGSVVSLGNNIDSGNTALLSGSGDQINTDPMLGGLLDNGGSVETMALLSGSPAVNAVPPPLHRRPMRVAPAVSGLPTSAPTNRR